MSTPATPYRSPAPFLPSYYESPRGGGGRFEVGKGMTGVCEHAHVHAVHTMPPHTHTPHV